MSDIFPVKVNITADLTEAINKVVDTGVSPIQSVHKGIVKVVSACTGKWFAHREQQTALIAAQTAKDVADINAGIKEYRNGELINLELAQTAEAYYRQISENNGACDAKRLEAAMLEAAIELSKIPEDEISDDPLNQTFFNHWRAEAELIDDEELRTWWAHLLVEETKKPNSISPRTLDVVKNLSSEEAKLFNGICNFCWSGFLIISDGTNVFDYGQFALFALQDAGLVATSFETYTVAGHEYEAGKSRYTILAFPQAGLSIAISLPDCAIGGFRLTKAGETLYRLITKNQNLKHLIPIAEQIRKQYPGSRVRIFKSPSSLVIGETPSDFVSPWDPSVCIWQRPYKERSGKNDHK